MGMISVQKLTLNWQTSEITSYIMWIPHLLYDVLDENDWCPTVNMNRLLRSWVVSCGYRILCTMFSMGMINWCPKVNMNRLLRSWVVSCGHRILCTMFSMGTIDYCPKANMKKHEPYPISCTMLWMATISVQRLQRPITNRHQSTQAMSHGYHTSCRLQCSQWQWFLSNSRSKGQRWTDIKVHALCHVFHTTPAVGYNVHTGNDLCPKAQRSTMNRHQSTRDMSRGCRFSCTMFTMTMIFVQELQRPTMNNVTSKYTSYVT